MSDSANRLLDDPPDLERASMSRESASRSPEMHEKLDKPSVSVFASIRSAFTVAWKDIRSIPRFKLSQLSRLLWQLLICIWIAGLLTLVVLLSFQTNLEDESLCGPDGDFRLKMDQDGFVGYDNNWWEFSRFFEVTLGWGELDFTSAKLIDVTWDLVVGRGGQAIMSLIVWRVFTEYLEVSLATKPATYTTIWLLRFYQDTSVLSSVRLFFQFFRRGLASKLAMWIIVMTLSFILSFPTIAGSMTGYAAFNDPFITSSDDRLFRFENVSPIAYVIHDGDRTANFTKDHIIPWRSEPSKGPAFQTFQSWEFCHQYNETWLDRGCELQWNVSQYVYQYGFNAVGGTKSGSRKNTTEFCGETIYGPPLNISAYFTPSEFYRTPRPNISASLAGDGFNGTSPFSKDRIVKTSPYNDRGKFMFVVDDDMYSITQLVKNGVCQPVKDTGSVQRYQWGFSFLQLYFVIVLLLLWSLALVVLWKTSHDMLKLNRREITSQDWKGLLDFTNTIRTQLEHAGVDVDSLTDKQLDDEILKLQGGSISSRRMSTSSFNVWRWLLNSKRWIIFGILTVVLLVSEHRRPHVPYEPRELKRVPSRLELNILQFVLPYTAICLLVALTVGANLAQKLAVFILAAGICIPFFFYQSSFRDFVLPGTVFGMFLAFAVGSTKGSRFVLFSVPFLCNYIVILSLYFQELKGYLLGGNYESRISSVF
ncbi:hypothetical protein EDB82DRAFT_482564 [Fusarium venenatum]|uniref:uncharacterized protein n=1 Tax=Fusarium venenatum TaxID=56646 RepID=UPI001D76087E|nr:hypothetical protein EDB82DRAFT_482564 [Fusarium venenatum]